MLLAFLAGLMALAGSYEDGVSALKAKDAELARTHFQAAVQQSPRSTAAWWQLGWAHYLLQDWDGTLAAWAKVRELDADYPTLTYWTRVAQARKDLLDPLPPLPEVPMEAAGRRITITAGGDTLMGSDLKYGAGNLPPDDGVGLFEHTGEIFRRADVAFLNLEGPLADGLPDRKCGPKSTACYAFRTPTSFTRALTSIGLDAASIANNHAMDLGTPGMQSSMDALDAAGIAHTGPYGDVGYVEKDGLTIAFVGAHSGTCCLNVNDLDDVQRAIRKADQRADLVVLSFHGGAEGYGARHLPFKTEIAWGERRGNVKELAHAAIDAGADLVVGHGPHVLRAAEVYRGRMIIYSLGNFMGYHQFGTEGGYGGHSVILEAELAENGVLTKARFHPLALDRSGVPHLDPKGTGLEHIRELTAADFPGSGLVIADDGVVSWNVATKEESQTSAVPGAGTEDGGQQ